MKKQINAESIIDAGKSLKTIGFLMIVILAMQVILLLVSSGAKSHHDMENIKTATIVCGLISFICGIIIMFQFISAGSSLVESAIELIEDVVLSPEEAKLREDEPKTYGGIVITTQEGHGLVVSATDLGEMEWDDAIKACGELTLNGHSDWRLPAKEELDLLYKNRAKIGGFANDNYWSSSEYSKSLAWLQNFNNGYQDNYYKNSKANVRAVRAF